MESKSFPSNFDIARRYAKHRKQHYLRYGEQRVDLEVKNIQTIETSKTFEEYVKEQIKLPNDNTNVNINQYIINHK